MKKLTAKILNEKIKDNWTGKQIAEYLGTTEKHFYEVLDKSFSPKAVNGFRADISRNEKRLKKTRKTSVGKGSETNADTATENKTTNTVTDTATENKTTNTVTDTATENKTTNTVTDTATENETSNTVTDTATENETSNTATIAELEASKILELEHLKEFEDRHKAIVSANCEVKNAILSKTTRVESLRKELSEIEKEVNELFNTLSENESEMADATKAIQIQRAKIDELDAQIEAKRILIVYVGYDEIEFDNPEIEFDSATRIPEWKEKFDELTHDRDIENLSVKQIKMLAKSIMMAHFLTEHVKYEMIFADETVETYFTKKVFS